MKLTPTLSNAGSGVKTNFAIALSALPSLQQLLQSVCRAATLHESRELLVKLADPRQSQKWIPIFRQVQMQCLVTFRFAARLLSRCRPVFCCAANIPAVAEHFRH